MRNLISLYRDPAVVIDPPAAVIPAAEPPVQVPDAAKPADLKPGSAAITLDLNKAVTPDVKVEPFILPEAYKDKPYLKGIDSQEKLLKMLDGAQELIGKKGPSLPKDDAPKEEWDKYYESLGRPKTADEYKLEGTEKGDQKFIPKVKAALHEAGLTPKQASIAWGKVNEALGEYIKEKGITDAQADVDFDKLATDSFGADRDKILATSKAILDANVSPAMKTHIANLSNENLIVLADVLNNINAKYIKQDGPGGKPTATGMTPTDLSNKARTLMAEQSKYNAFSPEFNALQKQIDECYDTMRRGTR